ncbi:phosphoadenosine phosphosulfate reductase family protein [Tumebacillus permanentifrigoris]|uniref:3'-phosphoadenosine 5'-phosphosulfate sulfotransferase (PAPS reductase)/FAD synthetase n=1 Tax=Tumebacillus permanentifrigoris TaxID=378543 RepID=A0A316DAK3_9BACL|nr:phosphoadenosine phosphosulfate reductase family protein [Tumebacillus permanentifrigoris]PWK10182.1 3'-phosphoadenosine 5'-phosphosulfate sulfotransferase (PAPS reductase)/FAD synthetase [Tumebacillus permanentifrigoris]
MQAVQAERFEDKEHELLTLSEYDVIIVQISGGKDSVACVLHLLERGISPEKIRLWHQEVDGRDRQFMDWPCTRRYLELFAQKFGLKLEFQWRKGGFLSELMKTNAVSAPIMFEHNGAVVALAAGQGAKVATRRRWPAMSASLQTRWCSSSLKIDVSTRVLNNHPELARPGLEILLVTGERREESSARAKYDEVLPHKSNSQRRRVDQWRMVIDWTEREVWAIFERFNLLPHPAYLLGFSRCSCFGCIFNTADLWAMMREIAPERFARLAYIERKIQFTIDNKLTLEEKANKGRLHRLPLDHPDFEKWKHWALSEDALQLEDLSGFVWPAGAMRGADGGSP